MNFGFGANFGGNKFGSKKFTDDFEKYFDKNYGIIDREFYNEFGNMSGPNMLNANDYLFQIIDIRDANADSFNRIFGAPSGGVLLVVSMRISNKTHFSNSFNIDDFKLVINGMAYKADDCGRSLDNGIRIMESVSGNETKIIDNAFHIKQMPSNISKMWIEVKAGIDVYRVPVVL